MIPIPIVISEFDQQYSLKRFFHSSLDGLKFGFKKFKIYPEKALF